MIVCQSKEANTLYFTTSVLKEMNIIRKFFNILCIPKTQIMISGDEYLVLVRLNRFFIGVNEYDSYEMLTFASWKTKVC